MNERLEYQAPSGPAPSHPEPSTPANLTVRRVEIPQAIRTAVNERIEAERRGDKR